MAQSHISRASARSAARPLSRFSCQRGYTLVELAIVLVVAGFIIAAIWIGASKAMYERKMVETESDVAEFMVNIREFYSGRQLPPNDSTNLLNSKLIQADAVPARLIHGAGLKHAFDTSAAVNSVLVYAGNTSAQQGAFTLWLAGLRREECVRFASRFGGANGAPRSSGVTGLYVNSQSFSTATPTQAAAACSATAPNSVGVLFTVR